MLPVYSLQALGQELALRFGRFELFPSRRLLLDAGKTVKLDDRALSILTLLAERAGQLVTKRELIAHAWANPMIEEINLRVHVAAIRRALGDGQKGNRYIINQRGQGYSFVAAVVAEGRIVATTDTESIGSKLNLPISLTRLVGRSEEIRALVQLAKSQRLISILGAGGVGKSVLALEVAKSLVDEYADGVSFVDLSLISNPTQTLSAIAVALQVAISPAASVWGLTRCLKSKKSLLFIDNCEHVIFAAASIVDHLLRECPGMGVLMTSREPLNATGEHQYRLTPLAVPSEAASRKASSAHEHAAVELFLERVISTDDTFQFTDTNAPAVGHICRCLDGIPLAIELAAARVSLLGVDGLAARLESQLSGPLAGRRTSASRQQSMRAALDWSFELLTETEKVVFRRLATFSGAFSMESAIGLVARDSLRTDDTLTAIVSLADKSLLATDVSNEVVRYRLLNVTRIYAFEKLAESDDYANVFEWHAAQTVRLMRQAELDYAAMSRSEWIDAYGYAIDDVRAAIDWACYTEENLSIGAVLNALALPFCFHLELVEEFRVRIELALYWICTRTAPPRIARTRLRAALEALKQATHSSEPASALEGRSDIQSSRHQLAPLFMMTAYQIQGADYADALRTAQRVAACARHTADPLAVLVADRVMAQAQHYSGNHGAARTYAERVLAHPAKSTPLAYIPVQVDRRVSMRIVLARILWMFGSPDQASGIVNEALELAASDSAFALCQVLALAACPIAFWRGDLVDASRHVRSLVGEVDRHRQFGWQHYADWYEYLLSSSLCTDLESEFRSTRPLKPPTCLLLDTLLTINPCISGIDLQCGDCKDALEWCAPEKLRILGERSLRSSREDSELLFARSLAIGEQQGALAWRLRTSVSLATLWRERGRGAEAFALLNDTYACFTEGFETRDLKEAKTLLESLA